MKSAFIPIPAAPTTAQREHLAADALCDDFNDADLADLRDLAVGDLTDPWWRKHLADKNPRESRQLRVLIWKRVEGARNELTSGKQATE